MSQKLAITIILGLGFIAAAVGGYSHIIDSDVAQLLQKGHVYVTQGVIVPYGNASSSGASGHVPGSFLTLVVGGPMKIWHSPWAALVLLTLIHFVTLILFLDVWRHFLSPLMVVVAATLYWLNPWRAGEIYLWNPGYIFLPAVLHLWTSYHLLSEKRSFWMSALHAFTILLAFQIHPSFIILIFMTLFLLWKKAMRPHCVGAVTGVLLGVLTLIPYILAGLKDPTLFPQPGGGGKGFLFFGLVYVYPVLKAFWYWILYGSLIFQRFVFHELKYDWLMSPSLAVILETFWNILKYLVGALSILLSFYVNFKLIKKYPSVFKFWKRQGIESSSWPVVYAAAALFSMLFAAAMSPTEPIYWHLLYVFPMALIPLLLFANEYLVRFQEQRKLHWAVGALVLYLFAFNLLVGLGSSKHSLDSNFDQRYHDKFSSP